MDRNCPGRERQREQPVKVGRCEKARQIQGAERVWVGRGEKGVEERSRREKGSAFVGSQAKGLGLFFVELGSLGKASE